ncbi:nuclease-related domain-containing protein [Staphylococcus massiliensis]|uniref:NERD domain-containing protein n=1 Tax=Staphylococcus massiliensis S46 TaxID=1229783 RepID=K9AVA7_9STAP|nr:nuclease-related domain-containing protein [Staphylococcus massiliensis]EKU50041.1 hypothetical protein C273_02193 [Staphylococcus massiliensis S46]
MNDYNPNKYWLAIENRCAPNKEIALKIKQLKLGIEGERLFYESFLQDKEILYLHNAYYNTYNPLEIDYLIVNNYNVYLFEIKNYTGDYYAKDHAMRTATEFEIPNPYSQLIKQKNEIKRLLSSKQIHYDLKAYIVYTNPTFTLHGDLPNRSTYLPPTELHKISSFFGPSSEKDFKVYHFLKAQQIDYFSHYQPTRPYKFNELQPGLKCIHCGTLDPIIYKSRYRNFTCKFCCKKFDINEAILSSLKDLYHITGKPFTFKQAQYWCKDILEWKLRHICKRHFDYSGTNLLNFKLKGS